MTEAATLRRTSDRPEKRRSRARRWAIGLLSLGLVIAGGVLLAPHVALAQTLSLDLDQLGGSTTARLIQIIAFVSVITMAPSLLVMVTSFTRIVVVMSFLRTALGTQQAPPSQVVIALSMFLTFFIMAPTLQRSYEEGLKPMMNEQVDQLDGLARIASPFHDFMIIHTREKDLALFLEIAKIGPVQQASQVPYHVLIPAFMISELKRAFEIGFLLFLPFLIIDMVVASVLMSMGMMMLPPVMISVPFKLIFFVLVDGWYLVVGSLVQSYGVAPDAIAPALTPLIQP
ncbi:flagellar type III secretion system pore protein FliP [Radicibacter daui]|uniref:flagellar type III secretion system pore protein FliP n=1 Tax=Radicibacter daui TaxID=3064829 RepID=UPI004046FCAD